MRNTSKWALITGALLVTCALSSCSESRTLSAFFGEERYLPEGSEQRFGAPRRPILNPLNNYPAAANDGMSDARDYTRPAVSTHASMGERRVPSENMAILSGKTAPVAAVAQSSASTPTQAASFAAPVAAVDTALNEPLKIAPETPAATSESAQQTTAFSEPVVLMKPTSEKPIIAMTAAAPEAVVAEQVPVAQEWSIPSETKEFPVSAVPMAASEPVSEATPTVIRLIPPSAPKPGGQVLNASSAPAIAVVTKPAIDATSTAEAEAAQAEYPSLASIPEAPEATPADKIAADIQSLDAERTNNQSASQALLSNADSTVMTSPETGQLVVNAATAMPTIEPSAGGEKQPAANDSSWLKNLLDPNEKKEAEEAKKAEEKAAEILASAESTSQTQDLTVPPVATIAAPKAIGTPLPMEQLAPSGQTEAAAVVAAANAAQAASVAPAPVAPASVADTSTSAVQLHPPVTVAEAVVVKADQQLTEIVEQPVEDAQPTVKKVQYLPESRYAKRRLAPVNEAY